MLYLRMVLLVRPIYLNVTVWKWELLNDPMNYLSKRFYGLIFEYFFFCFNADRSIDWNLAKYFYTNKL